MSIIQEIVDQCPCDGPVSLNAIVNVPLFVCDAPNTFNLSFPGTRNGGNVPTFPLVASVTVKTSTGAGTYTTMRRSTGPTVNDFVLYTYSNNALIALPAGDYCGWASDVDGNVVVGTKLEIRGDVTSRWDATLDITRMVSTLDLFVLGLTLPDILVGPLLSLKQLYLQSIGLITAMNTFTNTALEDVSIVAGYFITAMDFTTNIALKRFTSGNNGMPTPSFATNTELVYLSLTNCLNMVAPVLTTNTKLDTLVISNLKSTVTAIDIDSNALLRVLNVSNMVNLMTMSTLLNPALINYTAVNCPKLTQPDMSNNSSMSALVIADCTLVTSPVSTSGMLSLNSLEVRNQPTWNAADISNNDILTRLILHNMPLVTDIDTLGKPTLRYIDILNVGLPDTVVDAVLVQANSIAPNPPPTITGTVKLLGTGVIAAPTGTGLAAKALLLGKNWTVQTL